MSLRNSFGLEFYFSENEIYLDSATTSKIPISSLEKMNDFYKILGGGVNRGTHKKAHEANQELERARSIIADVFSVETSRMAFLPSRETAMTNLLHSNLFSKGDELLVSMLDYHSILAPVLKLKEIKDINLNYLSMKDESNLIESLSEKISNQTKAVILSSLTLGIGCKRDWQEITRITAENEALFVLDISNEAGHVNFDFSKTYPDAVISSGNIGALGPQGTAFQILSEETIKNFDPILVGGGSVISLEKNNYRLSSKIKKYEPGTLNIGGILALSNSLRALSKIGFDTIELHEKKLRDMIVDGLSNINKIDVIQIDGIEYGSILSFKSNEIDSYDIAIILEDLGNIAVRSGALCSHLLLEELKQESLIQISTHLYNTEEDIRFFLETLNSVMSEI